VKRPTCNTCPYFARNAQQLQGPGECRKNPPTPFVLGIDPMKGPAIGSAWSHVTPNHWCGEHPQFNQYVSEQFHNGEVPLNTADLKLTDSDPRFDPIGPKG
jgi:hypothetical protein